MRPLILVDGTTLKARYEGKLIIVTCQDANIQIYPLVVDIVDGETDLAMRWFFTKLREVIGDIENLEFVTGRGQSIINGIAEVFPEARHGYCMYHIQGNLKTRYRGSDIVALFRRVAEAYSFEEFTKFMGEIEHKLESAWEYLSNIGVEHWARSHFSERRYNMMTSNNAESLNALFKKDQELPILTMIEHIQLHECASSDTGRSTIQNSGSGKNSICGTTRSISLLREMRAQFQLESFPCAHAIAVAMYREFPPHSLCSHYYVADFWRAAYAETIFPLPNEVEWEVLDYIVILNNLLPLEVPPHTPSHRQMSRISSTREFPQRLKYLIGYV
ncbi:uncharacterized protein LOC111378930 [Olea europaea var. sylvestris]|uniref:uncharacterized protein LOC111378930 n=1 Tax=Olea europaea var. sylvestris TaxID=158386 RepID=UPI000C1D644B|nr:uncharacterized protein LOC111378930 [Olea europaea var. sylvestris]